MSSCSTVMLLGPPNTTRESPDSYNHDYSHNSSSTKGIDQSEKEYFEKIKGCYNFNFIPSMSALAALKYFEDTFEGIAKKNRSAYYAFKALKDDELRSPVRSDWRIKKYNLFCKALIMCYPLTFNWNKIPCACSSVMSSWSGTHDIPSSLFLPCFNNDTFTNLSILNHARTCKEDPIHLGIKADLEALYGINDIEEITCTEQDNQVILGTDNS